MSNFDVEREIAEQQESDYVFGAIVTPNIYHIEEARRQDFLPIGELQFGKEDFMDCASRSPTNAFEAYFTHAYQNNLFKPENKAWLEKNGYIQGGKVTFSDRFCAIGSGTTRSGNSLKSPLDFCHRSGMIPKTMLPKPEGATWDEYHNPASVTEEMHELGRQFTLRFVLNYERVYAIHFSEALKDGILCVASFAWPAPVNGEYPPSNNPPNHAYIIYRNKFFAFDNYIDPTDGDFIKKLAPGYIFFDYGYRVYVSKEVVGVEFAIKAYNIFHMFGLVGSFADFWEKFKQALKGFL